MKKVLKLGALAVIAFAMLFTVASCSDDDDDDSGGPALTALESAKAAYTAKVAELNTAKTASLSEVTTVVFGEVSAENDKFQVPFGGKYITKNDLKTYTDKLAKTADEVAASADSEDADSDDSSGAEVTDETKIAALNAAITALETAKTAFESAIKTLDSKWNADHFWGYNGADTKMHITGTDSDNLGSKKVAGSVAGLSEEGCKTYKDVYFDWLGYKTEDKSSATATTIADKNTTKTGYIVGKNIYDEDAGYISFFKSREAKGYVTEFSSDGNTVTRVKIVQTINDAIANAGNGLKKSEVDWYSTWAGSNDFPGTASDIKGGMMQYNVDLCLGGNVTENAAGTQMISGAHCSGIGTSATRGNKIKFVRLADNSGKKVTGNTACGGGTAENNKTYTTTCTGGYVKGDESKTFFHYDTKIPIIEGKTSVYKVTLQEAKGESNVETNLVNGVLQGKGLIMDFEVNIKAAAKADATETTPATQPFASYQFKEGVEYE